MQFTTLLSALASAAMLTSAMTIDNFITTPSPRGNFALPKSNIVVSPTILQPKGNETYFVGTTQTIVWDTTQIPLQAQNYTGTVLLGFWQANSSSENLDIGKLNSNCIPDGPETCD